MYLVPLVGGSGGGGVTYSSGFGPGGGAGGGAILIASSSQIIVNGTVTANGAIGGAGLGGCAYDGASGSGGAIRLVSNTISGTGTITALTGIVDSGGNGLARLEASTISFTGNFGGTPVAESAPPINTVFARQIPSVPPPSLQVTSINGKSITEHPSTFPDITINTDQPVPVVITGHQVPLGTVPMLTILGDSADQDNLPCTGGPQGTLATSTCTMNVTFPFGGSRGLYVTTWQNPGSNVATSPP